MGLLAVRKGRLLLEANARARRTFEDKVVSGLATLRELAEDEAQSASG